MIPNNNGCSLGRNLPLSLANLIAACPRHGDGVHAWLFNVARRLHAYRSHDEILQILVDGSADCGREVPAREIEDAVRNSARHGGKFHKTYKNSNSGGVSKPVWPLVDEDLRQSVIAKSPFSLADFQRISPVRIDGNTPNSAWFVEKLFRDDLICVGRSRSLFETNQAPALAKKLAACTLIVPSAMTGVWGITKEGKRSMHALSNTGPRMYQVVEFDKGSFLEQASILHHLSEFAPLVMVLWSGGKSTHGWFCCQGVGEEDQHKFFNYAVKLGADPRMWSRCQFARLPQGWRADKQARQQVYFFNPQNTWKAPLP